MKHKKMYLSMILLLSLVFAVSCNDDDKEEQLSNVGLITHADVLGVYEVQNSQSVTVRDGDIWNVKVKMISIGCSNAQALTFKDNTLLVGDNTYQFERVADSNDSFKVSFKEGADQVSFVLAKTTRGCDDEEIEAEIPKSEILGTFKVVDAYTNESGAENTPNATLIGKIWLIEDAQISINCALQTVAYTYGENTIVAEDISYFVAKENTQLVVTYIVGNRITTLRLEATTETCPEEEKPETGKVELDKLYGYAEGTTGGEGGKVHHFDNGKKFTQWLALREKTKSSEPATVWLSGTFTKTDGRDASHPWFDIKDTENITIYGTNSFKMQNVGFFINRAENIIIRNVYLELPKADNGADGISMQDSERIWVDHCTFKSVNQTKDYEDGSCDVTHGTKKVTVSWNHFIQTQKTALVGHSDSQTSDVDITATFHHNFFDKSNSRHPRVRYGTVHVYNNFFNAVTTYGTGSAFGAKVLVENNYYDNVHLPTDISTYPAKKSGSSWVSNLNGKVAGFLFSADNHYENKPSNASDPYPFTNVEYTAYEGEKLATPLTRADFTPAYTYVVDEASKVGSIVSNGAGVGKLPNYETAPIAVDNGGIEDGGEEPEPGEPEETEPVDMGNDWFALPLGDVDIVNGSYSIQDDNTITIVGTGKTEGSGHSSYFIYREIEGDFEASVKLESYIGSRATSNQGFGGLMLVEDVSVAAGNLIMGASAKGADGSYGQYSRVVTAAASRNAMYEPTTTGDNLYLKLRREGNAVYSSYSLDGGVTYGAERKQDKYVDLAVKVKLGLSVNSSETGNNKLGTATFSDFKINGTSFTFAD